MIDLQFAKRIEFPAVFVVGLEENLFPSMMNLNTRHELEEERRLFYVALTRAEKYAHLTFAISRFRWGKIIDCEPSRFLEEIDDKYLDWKNLNVGNPINRSGLDASLFEDNFSQSPRFERKKEKPKRSEERRVGKECKYR